MNTGIGLVVYKRMWIPDTTDAGTKYTKITYEPLNAIYEYENLTFGKNEKFEGTISFNVPITDENKTIFKEDRIVMVSYYNETYAKTDIIYTGIIKTVNFDVTSHKIQVAGKEINSLMEGMPFMPYSFSYSTAADKHYAYAFTQSAASEPIGSIDIIGSLDNKVRTFLNNTKLLNTYLSTNFPGHTKIGSVSVTGIWIAPQAGEMLWDLAGMSVKDFAIKVHEVQPDARWVLSFDDILSANPNLNLSVGVVQWDPDNAYTISATDYKVQNKSYTYSTEGSEQAWWDMCSNRAPSNNYIPIGVCAPLEESLMASEPTIPHEGYCDFKCSTNGIDRNSEPSYGVGLTSRNLWIEQSSREIKPRVREISFTHSDIVKVFPSPDVSHNARYIDTEFGIDTRVVCSSWTIVVNNGVMNIIRQYREV